MIDQLIIATRKSKLAISQTNLFVNKVKSLYPEIKIYLKEIVTKGDKWLETPLYEHGGKGLFIKELEVAILQGEADLAIHSLKDMPYDLPDGLEMLPVLERASPFDALLSENYSSIDMLPLGAVIGTSSLRRHWQLSEFRKDLEFKLLRGNIHTRVNKLLAGEYDAIILAEAGLQRVEDIHVKHKYVIPKNIMIPAVGQGILAAEYKTENYKLKGLLSSITDKNTKLVAAIERDLNKAIGGTCQTPVAGYAWLEDDKAFLSAWVGSTKSQCYRAMDSCFIDEHHTLGAGVAKEILLQGDIDWR